MARTTVNSELIRDSDISRVDLNTDEVGQSVIAKVIAGDGVSIQSTGADAGTGDVTVNADINQEEFQRIETILWMGI